MRGDGRKPSAFGSVVLEIAILFGVLHGFLLFFFAESTSLDTMKPCRDVGFVSDIVSSSRLSE